MGAAENKQIIEKMYAALAQENVEGYFAHLADDVRYTLMGSKYAGTYSGKQEVYNKMFAPIPVLLEGAFRLVAENMIAEGDYVVVQAHGQNTTKAGKPYNNTYCQVFRFANGKVQEIMEYLDTELVTATFGQ